MAIIVFVVVVKIEIEIAFVQNCDRATFHCYIDFFEFSNKKIKLRRDLKIRIKIHY